MKSENHAVDTTRIENPGYQVSGSWERGENLARTMSRNAAGSRLEMGKDPAGYMEFRYLIFVFLFYLWERSFFLYCTGWPALTRLR